MQSPPVRLDVFINAVYLYDDKLTLILNSGDKPVTINDRLLSMLEDNNKMDESLFLDKPGPLAVSPRRSGIGQRQDSRIPQQILSYLET